MPELSLACLPVLSQFFPLLVACVQTLLTQEKDDPP